MDALFPSSNEWGIPDLDPEWQADCVPLPVWAWGSVPRSREHAGTWHFFVSDDRFNALLTDPSNVVSSGCSAACELDQSLFDNTPHALAIAAIYRRRWVARYWQTCGVRILIDLNLPQSILYSPWFRDTIPSGWSAFATRGYERRIEALDFEMGFAREFCKPAVFLVVGGGRQVAEWCVRNGAIHSGCAATKEPYRVQG